MRIGFLGKGGSGKTTIAAGFAHYMQRHHSPVVAIDADINAHLHKVLGLPKEPKHIGYEFERIASYLRGNRTDLRDMPMIATTPPSLQSAFVRISHDDQFLCQYGVQHGNIIQLTVGSYHNEDIGSACYHTKLGALELVLHHLLDGEEDLVIADATAGIDNLGTSLFFVYDLNLFVVEPTIKSIGVFHAFQQAARERNLPAAAVLNKIQDENDIAFIKAHIPEEQIVTQFPVSKHIRRLEQGETSALESFVEEHVTQFEDIALALRKHKKNWADYYNRLLDAHRVSALDWWSDYYKQPIHEQKDPSFSYEKVIAR